MRHLIALLIICLGVQGSANAGDSVFYGAALNNKHIEGVEVPCPKDHICMDGWFKWNVRVKKMISGPKLKGRLSAAVVHHAEYVPSYLRSLSLFVVRPIENEEQRRLLGADYYLLEYSPPVTMYCFRRTPSEYSWDVPSLHRPTSDQHSNFCFREPAEDDGY